MVAGSCRSPGKTAILEGTGTTGKVHAGISLKAECGLDMLLEVAGLVRPIFFYHQAQLSNADPHAELNTAITEVFECNRGRVGHRRVDQVLINAG